MASKPPGLCLSVSLNTGLLRQHTWLFPWVLRIAIRSWCLQVSGSTTSALIYYCYPCSKSIRQNKQTPGRLTTGFDARTCLALPSFPIPVTLLECLLYSTFHTSPLTSAGSKPCCCPYWADLTSQHCLCKPCILNLCLSVLEKGLYELPPVPTGTHESGRHSRDLGRPIAHKPCG